MPGPAIRATVDQELVLQQAAVVIGVVTIDPYAGKLRQEVFVGHHDGTLDGPRRLGRVPSIDEGRRPGAGPRDLRNGRQ